MAQSRNIKIECEAATSLPHVELEPFQGQLKKLTKENYKLLRDEILRDGFSAPLFVWQRDGKNYVLDGHQRLSAVRRMVEEGYNCPDLPVAWISADNEKQARRKILALTSQYGIMTQESLLSYAEQNEIELQQILESCRFPEIDFSLLTSIPELDGTSAGSGNGKKSDGDQERAKEELDAYVEHQKFKIINSDCLRALKDLPAESIDSLVTDPPAGIAFMGKDWDDDKGGRDEWIRWLTEVMTECLRVLKPGAHGLVWALPRTSHWTATALENAGFEIRDILTHCFGSGFPKSLDVSKAIDKAAARCAAKGGLAQEVKDGDESQSYEAFVPLQGFGTALKPSSENWILVRKPLAENTVAANVLKYGTGALNIDGTRISTGGEVVWKVPESDKQSDSLMIYDKPGTGSDSMFKNKGGREGTPLGRFPANFVLSHNPDCKQVGVKKVKASRNNTEVNPKNSSSIFGDDGTITSCYSNGDGTETVANFICSENCAVAELDRQSGTLKSGGFTDGTIQQGREAKSKGAEAERIRDAREPSTGGASRFFKTFYYCAKASKSQRDRGNSHPTVKPIKLMRYFCRLVTPPGGFVLDPFAGSGTTGVAAVKEDFRFLGIEREPEYAEIAKSRIDKAVSRTASEKCDKNAINQNKCDG